MTTLDRTLAALIGLAMICVVALAALDKSTDLMGYIATALIGIAAGKQINAAK